MSAVSSSTHLKSLVRCAMFAALIAALGALPPLPVPVIPVPITAQTLGVMLAGAILGPRLGVLSVLLFMAVVALGFPLLAGGRGGLGVFFAPSAGFLFGWLPGALIVGVLARGAKTNLPRLIVACLAGGIVGVYVVGVPWMAFVADLTILQAAVAALAFVPGDIVKAVAAALAARAIHRGYPSLGTTSGS